MFEDSLYHYQKKNLAQGFHKSLGEVKNESKTQTKSYRKPQANEKKRTWRKKLCIYDVVSYGRFIFACVRGRYV